MLGHQQGTARYPPSLRPDCAGGPAAATAIARGWSRIAARHPARLSHAATKIVTVLGVWAISCVQGLISTPLLMPDPPFAYPQERAQLGLLGVGGGLLLA